LENDESFPIIKNVNAKNSEKKQKKIKKPIKKIKKGPHGKIFFLIVNIYTS